ncbi:Fanconi anemia group E protein isoform X1 [Syngnathus acus]|uniref:Fanconi anemia group E protein isoform X1 n=1 Tax=Syngnathus acus TaxID=161584 RepID=UPI001886468A|nr:Fanconi anemia group E protein isoform X1 [Syngnathus acus]
MNAGQLLSRFDGQWKLLARSLFFGVSGAHRTLEVFKRQQRATPDRSLSDLIETLCRDEITYPGGNGQPLTVKPLVLLFPPLFKQNLLAFIFLIHSRFPKAAILHLLRCLDLDPCPSLWVAVWTKQLKRIIMGCPLEEPLYSPACAQRLTALSRRVGGETGWWDECSGLQVEEAQTAAVLSETGSQKKRKAHFDILNDENEEMQQEKKRMKTNEPIDGQVHDQDCLPEHMKMAEELETDAPEQVNTHEPLPEHMKASVLQIKELLKSPTEWDNCSLDVLKVLNDCNATQAEVLCGQLNLSDLAEHTLIQICGRISVLLPDLSFSTAATLIKNLLLQRVLSLTEPPSRCLVSAVTSLCSSYPRSMCHALIGPLIEQDNMGSAQAELLNKLIEGCLDTHYRLLVLQMTLKISWSEMLLSVIHSLLDSKPDLNEELFTLLIEQLVNQTPLFTKSVRFAKMMLTTLTKYGNLVNASHKHSLSDCLMLNETFLKKALQAVLKRIPDA